MNSKTNVPIKYIGGKVHMKEYIYLIIPEHDVFVDVFGGAGHIIYNKECKNNKINIYNDINSDMVNLFIQFRDNTDEICKKLEMTPYSRKLHEEYNTAYINRDIWNTKTDLERAMMIYYLIKSSFNGIIGGNKNNTSFSSAKKSANSYYETIKKIRNLYKNVVIENNDFRMIIQKYDSPTTIFYLHPPYFGTEELYTSIFTENDHLDLFNILKNIRGKFILSYYHCKITELYKNNNFIFTEHKVKNAFGNKRTELIITNFEQNKQSKKKSLFGE